ncbi:hypothetical protein ACIQWA_06905 [Kitasatospora sp. NPDC098652]|uniref:hypothetical protein n=1 Tax=Kitasatospora sp. NPDC098652 TaxID=3364095 RepID=UPI0037FD4456
MTAPLSAPAAAATGALAAVPLDGLDPLAIRLVLLGHAHQAPAHLTAEALAQAQASLIGWRKLVANLARSPSRALTADAVQQAFDALADDLNASTALHTLHELEQRRDLPDGARFETYLRLDQVLALELGRDIGRDPA